MVPSIISACRKAFVFVSNQSSPRSIHTVNLVALHQTLHKPKEIDTDYKAFQAPSSQLPAFQSKDEKKAAEIERLREFWSKEPARVMRTVRAQQFEQRHETAAKLKKQNATDPFMARYLDSNLRSEIVQLAKEETPATTSLPSEKVFPEELGPGYASPEEVFLEEHGPLCGSSCSNENVNVGIDFSGKSQRSQLHRVKSSNDSTVVAVKSAEPTEFVAHAVHTFDDVAWMKAYKNGCKKPCKKHSHLFAKPLDGTNIKVDVKTSVNAKVDVEVHVEDALPSIWWYRSY